MRVKDVIRIRIAGARERTVRTIAISSVDVMFSGFVASLAPSSRLRPPFSAGREEEDTGFGGWGYGGFGYGGWNTPTVIVPVK